MVVNVDQTYVIATYQLQARLVFAMSN